MRNADDCETQKDGLGTFATVDWLRVNRLRAALAAFRASPEAAGAGLTTSSPEMRDLEKFSALQAQIATLTAERDEARNNCNGSCDIALARRQIGPDGIVPGNARQCAELWEREASRERAAHAETRKIADQLKDQMQLVKAQISEACPGVVTFMYSHAIRDIARERDEAKKAHAETRKALEEARDERNAFREQMGVAERERDQALAVNSERVREIDALRAERDRLAADPRLELPYVVDVPLPTGSKAMAAFRIEAYAHEWPTAARLIGAEVVSPDAVKAAPAPARAEAVSERAKAFREIAERVSRFQTIAADGLVSAAWVVGYCEARAEAEATKGVGGEGR